MSPADCKCSEISAFESVMMSSAMCIYVNLRCGSCDVRFMFFVCDVANDVNLFDVYHNQCG